MLNIKGKYQSVKPVLGDKKTLLLTFLTQAGELGLIVSSEQWMKYFVTDSTPKKDSKWLLTIRAKAIPELNRTMLVLISAKPNFDNSDVNFDRVVGLLEQIYDQLKKLGFASERTASLQDDRLKTDNDNHQINDDYEQSARDYQPDIEAEHEKNEVELPEVPTDNSHQFSLENQPAKKVDPAEEAVEQGTGDSITDTFFQSPEITEDQGIPVNDKDANSEETDALGTGPLNITEDLSDAL